MDRRRIGVILLTGAVIILVVFAGILVYTEWPTLIGNSGVSATPTSTFPQSTIPVGDKGCTEASPYGFTTIHADAQLVSQYKQLNVCWVRFQVHVDTIRDNNGNYDWSNVDQAVKLLNAAGVHIDFPIQCFGGSCFSQPSLPTTDEMTQFATAIATRYDGKHGHGKIDAFEIGNEEYDFYDPGMYGPLLKAGYQAIKAVYPTAMVGMYGTHIPKASHIQDVMNAIANGYSDYLDFANFHYYAHGGDPRVSETDHPSFNDTLQMIHTILPNKPIWVTEVGWTTSPLPGIKSVSPETQAEYLKYVTEAAATSNVVQKMFWFTINYGNQGDTIYPPGGPRPAFYVLQTLVQQRPRWN